MRHRGCLLLVLVLVAILAAARPGRAQLTGNQVYKAVEPCRVVDTRIATPATPLSANVVRAFDVVGGASLAAQGGSASGCGVPGYGGLPTPSHPRVQAVMMNFTAVGPAGAGNLRAWASGPAPNASVLNYDAGTTVANGVIVPIDQDQTPGADLRVRADVAGTHLVIDVLGYFSEKHPLAGEGRPNAGLFTTGANEDVFQLCLGPTGVHFSLSFAAVHGDASRAACDAGSWVCSRAERGTAPCDTWRPDHHVQDGRNCDGSTYNLNANAHLGWLADTAFPGLLADDQVYSTSELGGTAATRDSCLALPVWCCTF